MTNPDFVPCPNAPWWEQPQITSSTSNLIWVLWPAAVLIVLAVAFVVILIVGVRRNRHRRSVEYLSLQGGCGAAVIVWGLLLWLFWHLPSCM